MGAVRFHDGKLPCLLMLEVNTETFQIFLHHLETQAGERRVLLVLDNVSGYKAKWLIWGHIEPLYLPPYSPDFTLFDVEIFFGACLFVLQTQPKPNREFFFNPRSVSAKMRYIVGQFTHDYGVEDLPPKCKTQKDDPFRAS